MKVLVIGATGRLGKLLVAYSLEEGHEVIAFSPNIDEFPFGHEKLTLFQGDAHFQSLIASAAQDVDVIFSVVGIRKFSGPITLLSDSIRNIIGAMQKLGKKRIITITGAGILQDNERQTIMESLSFPPNLQNLSLDHQRVWELLRASDLDWTIACPAFMHTRERTGKYLVAKDYYPKQALNEVSVEDVADFMVKEMVENQYLKSRVGIASPRGQ
jgi:putative NADH-flavin reductase